MSIDVKKILSIPQIYLAAMRFVGGTARSYHITNNIRPAAGMRILDVGCGPADIIEQLPSDIEYVGIDIEPNYVDYARERFGHRAQFFCEDVVDFALKTEGTFDVVLASGLLHHLNDEQSIKLMTMAKKALRSGGRFITWDGCYKDKQAWSDRWMLRNDRGKFVRTQDQYLNLARTVFSDIDVMLRDDLLRIPYTILAMMCTKE